jgi:long-subunit fatty acid transport protein
MMRLNYVIASFFVIFLTITSATAQNRYDVLRYVSTLPGSDAVTSAYGGASTALGTGLGSVSDNPAVMGMMKQSSFNIGFNNRRIQEQAIFGSSNLFLNQGTTTLSDAGFIYNMPTVQGSFVFGASYSKLTDFLRGYQIFGYNNQTTLTDGFSNPNSQYYDLAYRKAYFDIQDGDVSIFRLAPFAGINQDVQQTEKGQLGEFNFYSSFEAAQNLFVGASVSIPFGFYRYQRFFLEEDTKGLYFGEFFVQYPDGNKYFDDVREVFTLDEIDATITGLYARLGVAYKLKPWLNLGLSYRTSTKMNIREDYLSSLEINFDNGDFIGPEQLDGKVDYTIKSPSRINIGAAIDDLNGLSVSGSLEYIPYSTAELSFKNASSSDIAYQRDQNRLITSEFNDVVNLKVGVGYRLGSLEPILGYSYYPAVSKDFGSDISTYSGGLKIKMNEDISFNIAGSYSDFKDSQTVYQGISGSENVALQSKKIQVTAGLVFRF